MADGKLVPGDAPMSGFFKSAKKKAAAILKSPDDLKGFLGDVEERLERDDKGRLKELVVDVKTLVRWSGHMSKANTEICPPRHWF